MLSPFTEKLIKQLKKAGLSIEDRTALTTALLTKLNALPLHNSIQVSLQEGMITIKDKPLTTEQIINFKQSATILKENFAYQVINEQIRYLAINLGVHIALSPDTVMFSKAALWILQEEEKLLDEISTV